jgi:hypothetical protein
LLGDSEIGGTPTFNKLPQNRDLPSTPPLTPPKDNVLPPVPARLSTREFPAEEPKIGEALAVNRLPQDSDLPSPSIDVPPKVLARLPTTRSPFEEYKVGETLSLNRLPQVSDLSSPTINVRIRELKTFALSCTMLVDIDGSPERTVFLKLYDRRFSQGLRKNQCVDPWEPATEEAFTQYVQSGAVQQFIHSHCHLDIIEDGWHDVEREAFIADQVLQYYKVEAAVYNALREFQGKEIPRLLAAVDIDLTPPGADDHELFHVKGILLEYIDGFSLDDLADHAPRSAWQGIVDQAVAATHLLGDHNILDWDRRPINYMVSPTAEDGFRVVMIDFGVARFRKEDESDSDWGRAKFRENEEGAVGTVMKWVLSQHGFELHYEPSSRYMEWAGPDGT